MRTHGLKRTDFAVIAVLWGLDIFVPWVNAWSDFTIKSSFGDKLTHSTPYFINIIFLMVVKCAVCLALALIADLRNRKFKTYFISLFVYAITPVFAIITILSRLAPLGFVIPWIGATYFATTPLRFCSIFNQKPRALPDQTRLVVAFFDFVIGVSQYFITERQEELSKFPETYIIVLWVIKIPIFVLIITLTESIRNHLKQEVVTEPSLKAVIEGIKKDMRSEKRNKYIGQFTLFMIIMQPVLVITFIDKILGAVDFENTRHISNRGVYRKFEYLSQMVFLPLLCVVVSFGRGFIGRFGDLVVIAIAHLFNTLICVLLYLFLLEKQTTDELASEILHGAPASPGHASLLIINGTEHQYYFKTPFYETPTPVGVLHLDIHLPKGTRTFELMESPDGSSDTVHTVDLHANKRYRFLTIGTDKKIEKIIQVYGEDDYKVHETETVVLVMNGIVGETVNGIEVPEDSKNHIIEIQQSDRTLLRTSLSQSHQFLKLQVPSGVLKLSYLCQGNNDSCGGFHPSSLRVQMEPFTEVTWVITNDGHTRMKLYSTLHVSPEQIEKAKQLFTRTYSLAGLAQSATAVGYIQFFWTESPIRLRTTLYAILVVSNELLLYIISLVVSTVTPDLALGCICLCCLGFVAHVIIGLWYDLKFRRESWLYLDESVDNVIQPK
ncbi:hypothetical protein GE061_006540 [Apolygus lucorum]|uniref:Uncharacterized protein n=1 Tax=Apolygus lucorum TaxID=248454 RepID=A0A6A4J493_APOLU|nr:hypothetical protein GE061_006540 [Apolygus lucorum]